MRIIIAFMKKYRVLISYVVAGGLTTLVSLCSYFFLVLFFLDPRSGVELQIANMISWAAAVAFAYITNRKYVFRSKNQCVKKEAAAFFSSRLTTLLLDMAMMFVMVTWLKWNDRLAKLVVQVIIMAANYLLSKFFVFDNV